MEKYKAEGYRVGICGRNADTLNPLKDEFQVYKLDVTNLEAVKEAVEDFAKDGLDIMFANAGVGYAHKTQNLTSLNLGKFLIQILMVLSICLKLQLKFFINKVMDT